MTNDGVAAVELSPPGGARLESRARRRSRRLLSALLISAGVLHFVVPAPFAEIVPRVLGHPRFWVCLSGVAELASGALLLDRRTARIGAMAAAATFVAVYPANIQMAIDAGWPTDVGTALTWLRLPLQFVLVAWALRHARD